MCNQYQTWDKRVRIPRCTQPLVDNSRSVLPKYTSKYAPSTFLSDAPQKEWRENERFFFCLTLRACADLEKDRGDSVVFFSLYSSSSLRHNEGLGQKKKTSVHSVFHAKATTTSKQPVTGRDYLRPRSVYFISDRNLDLAIYENTWEFCSATSLCTNRGWLRGGKSQSSSLKPNGWILGVWRRSARRHVFW